MSHKPDPVDAALEALRATAWNPSPHYTQLEEKLMSQFDRPQSQPRRGNPVLYILAGVAVIGGAAFATTTLRTYWATVEVDGQTHELELTENGQQTIELDTADGGTALVTVEKATDGADGEMTRVEVQHVSGDGENRTVDKTIRRRHELADDSDYTVDDLGDTAPAATWSADGLDHALYFLPGTDPASTRIFAASTSADGETTVRLLASPPMVMWGDDQPEVTMDPDGTMTIIRESEGRQEVMKMKFRIAADEGDVDDEDMNGDVEVETPEGGIRVRITPSNGG